MFVEVLDWRIAVAGSAVVIAGLMRGFAGFGSAMFLAPVLAFLFGPAQMVAISMFIELAVALPLLRRAAREAEWGFVVPVAIAAACFMPLGAWFLVNADPAILTRLVGAIVLLFVVVIASGWRYRGPKRTWIGLGIGALSGTMVATTSIGGPPMLLYMLAGPDNAQTNRANIIIYFMLIGIAMLAVLWGSGIISEQSNARAAILALPFMLASWFGARLFDAASERLYRRIALVLLALVGLFGILG